MEGALFKYVWQCGEISGYQYLRCISMNAYKDRWYKFEDINTGEKVVIHRDMYPAYRWINDGIGCFYTLKIINYGKQQTEEPEQD